MEFNAELLKYQHFIVMLNNQEKSQCDGYVIICDDGTVDDTLAV